MKPVELWCCAVICAIWLNWDCVIANGCECKAKFEAQVANMHVECCASTDIDSILLLLDTPNPAYYIQLQYPDGTSTNCFYPGSGEITLNCSHSDIGVAGTVNWVYSGNSGPPTSLPYSGIPNAKYSNRSGTEHIVTISPVEQSLDGQTIQCQFIIGEAGLYRSDPVEVLIAPGGW